MGKKVSRSRSVDNSDKVSHKFLQSSQSFFCSGAITDTDLKSPSFSQKLLNNGFDMGQ